MANNIMLSDNKITVVIPTRNRPIFLANALDSIRRQTAIQQVAEIVVSENGKSRESEVVCANFKSIPIRYVYRDRPLGLLEHHKELLGTEPKTKYVAMLHDDDWWDEGHLASAHAMLEAGEASVAAYFGNIYESRGVGCPNEIAVHGYWWRAWIVGGCDFRRASLPLDLVAVLEASLLETTFHFSTLVGRVAAVRSAIEEVHSVGNEFDFDRTFPVLVAEHGAVIFGTAPNVTIQVHPEQDNRRYGWYGLDLKAVTTRWMADRWPEATRQAGSRFNATVPQIAPSHWQHVSELTGEPLRSLLIDKFCFNLFRAPAPRRDLRWLVKQATPAGLLALRQKLLLRKARRQPSEA